MNFKAIRALTAWYQRPMGRAVFKAEQRLIQQCLPGQLGHHSIALMPFGELPWFIDAAEVHRHHLICRGSAADSNFAVYADYECLSLASESVDFVFLPHIFECSAQPEAHLLTEVSRVLVPEGLVLVLGFNPWSWFGLPANLAGHGLAQSGLKLRRAAWVQEKLEHVNLTCRSQQKVLLTKTEASLSHPKSMMQQKLNEWLQVRFGAVYALVASKKASALSPIRPRWSKPKCVALKGELGTITRDGL